MKHYDVIIIGGGVAGMTAALYLKKANLSCCIFERETPGGAINYTPKIENYPGYNTIVGADLAYNIYSQLEQNDIPFIYENVQGIKLEEDKNIVTTTSQKYSAKNIIIAVGRHHKNLNVKNETELQTKGISYCAICDGNLYKNKEVVVVGGGNNALTSALYLSGLCKKVTLLHRSNNFRGENSKLDSIKNKANINIKTNVNVKEFIKDEYNNLSAVKLDNDEKITAQGCFICIGFDPATSIFNNLEIINNSGYIEVNENMETKIQGIYAIGDVRQGSPCQIVPAMSDGVIAALHIINNYN